jgi:hypothetical protein
MRPRGEGGATPQEEIVVGRGIDVGTILLLVLACGSNRSVYAFTMSMKQVIESRMSEIKSSKARIRRTFLAQLSALSREAQRRAAEEGAELPMSGFLEGHMEHLRHLREEFAKLEHTRLALLEALRAMDFDEASAGNAG